MPETLGFVGWIGRINAYIFGSFGLCYPFVLLPLNFIFYKRGYTLNNVRKSEFIGLCVAFVAFALLFSVLSQISAFVSEAGWIPEVLLTIFSAIFGLVGSGFAALLLILFSIVLVFPRFVEIVFNVKVDFTIFERVNDKIKSIITRLFGDKFSQSAENSSHQPQKNTEIQANLNENANSQSDSQNAAKSDDIDIPQDFKDALSEISAEFAELENSQKTSENSRVNSSEIWRENSRENLSVNSSENRQNFTPSEDFDEPIFTPQIQPKKTPDELAAELADEFEPKNKDLQDFIAKASLDESPKKEAFVPEKFLKTRKIDDIKLNLNQRSNLDEPSYKRKQISVQAQQNATPQPFELIEREAQKPNFTPQPNDEFTPQVRELDEFSRFDNPNFTPNSSENSSLNSTQNSNFTQNSQPNFTPNSNFSSQNSQPNSAPNADLQGFNTNLGENFTKNSPFGTKNANLSFDSNATNSPQSPQNQAQSDFQRHPSTIKTQVESNAALLNSLEKGTLAKPKDFKLPPLDFLVQPTARNADIDEGEIDRKIYDLLEKLRRFKIGGDVISTYTGPVVTTFEFRPSADVKVSRILALQDDLAMALRATSIRIQAPIPGKDVVGIEVPNEQIQTIYLREILESEVFKNAKSPLTIALGKDIVGNAFITDLKKLPHLLIAGTTGSGKSVGINAMLLSLLYRNSPKSLRLVMIDPKMLEFSIYNDIPHLLTPVITDPKKAIVVLSNMVAEMERRYKLMAEAKTKNIENYNDKMLDLSQPELPYIVVIIDELADLMMTAGKDVEFYIGRLAQMARASGIHLIVATQRPSVDVVTGLIKANLPSRLAYKVGQRVDSKVILDAQGAESLLGRGDSLFTPPGTSNLVRLHAPFASEMEIEKIVEFLKAQQIAEYDENFLKDAANSSPSGVSVGENTDSEGLDELYEQAKAVILEDRKTSISYLQRRLKIGYNRAANIIEQLSDTGFLSTPDNKGQREIL